LAIEVIDITKEQFRRLAIKGETHFSDFKAKAIAPAKLTRTLSAFANADGGELYVGIEDLKNGKFSWAGFPSVEDANGHIQAIEGLFPLGAFFRYTFLRSDAFNGLVLQCEIDKTQDIGVASDGRAYLRRGAQNLPQTTEDQLNRLKYSKGIISYEDHPVNTPVQGVTQSNAIASFMEDVVPAAEPEAWLRKQRLLIDDKPTVCGLVLFSDEPQIDLPKATIKVYRYKTSAPAGTRDTLAFDPLSIEGNAYAQIYAAVDKTREITEEIPLLGQAGLEKIEYPTEAIHEIITNAVIHRDYSVNDDVHIRVFDNRIEITSPGALPGHVTAENILDERFARNPKVVRLLNKHKNPPNKDVGEGLNTAFEAMRKLKLKDPIIQQKDSSVVVTLKHEKLGTPEQIIVEYLKHHIEIKQLNGSGYLLHRFREHRETHLSENDRPRPHRASPRSSSEQDGLCPRPELPKMIAAARFIDTARTHKDADCCYGVSFPHVPGGIAAGDTLDEAIVQAAEVLAFA
jgi:ATP-dependent DNA helicase RecG